MAVNKDNSHLEELSSKERIKLVQGDSVRRWGQIIISFIFIGSGICYLGWYLITHADAEFQKMVAIGMFTLVSGGIGASLAIFGLGRTVGRK